jgi:hypothetical protein
MGLKIDKYTHFGKNPKEDNIDIFYSSDMKEELELNRMVDLDIFAWQTAEKFLDLNVDYNKLINVYAKKNNLENIAILAAHTKKIKNSWFYFNEDSGSSIQCWINKEDGKYKALIICSCNPEENELTSEISPIITPNEPFSINLFYKKDKIQADFYLPNRGNIDSYLIEEELKRLK